MVKWNRLKEMYEDMFRLIDKHSNETDRYILYIGEDAFEFRLYKNLDTGIHSSGYITYETITNENMIYYEYAYEYDRWDLVHTKEYFRGNLDESKRTYSSLTETYNELGAHIMYKDNIIKVMIWDTVPEYFNVKTTDCCIYHKLTGKKSEELIAYDVYLEGLDCHLDSTELFSYGCDRALLPYNPLKDEDIISYYRNIVINNGVTGDYDTCYINGIYRLNFGKIHGYDFILECTITEDKDNNKFIAVIDLITESKGIEELLNIGDKKGCNSNSRMSLF